MIELLFFAFAAASLSNFLDDCMAPEMIFGKYGNWIRSKGFWGKPFGGCLICMNVWVSACTYIVFLQPCSLIDWLLILPFIGISNTFLKFIIR
jgi:hypothetical protein